MRFEEPVVKGRLIKRYKRFLADVILESGETITAHCPNSGSMMTCLAPDAPVILTVHDDPKRKLKHTLELIKIGRGWIGVNTMRPNHIVEEGVRRNKIQELAGYSTLKREVKYGKNKNSRIDLLLTDVKRPPCYVEVKNTTFLERPSRLVRFPDAVTERGLKHLLDLENEVKKGNRGVIFFLVQRSEAEAMAPADAIDPAYGKTLRRVLAAGVEVLAYKTERSPHGITLTTPVPLSL